MKGTIFKRADRTWVWLALLLLGLASFDSARAQIQVAFQLNKKAYMTHEAVAGQLSITNRSGQDLVLQGRNGAPWLDFQVTDTRGNLISPYQNRAPLGPVMIRSGDTFKKQVFVNRRYPMGQKGTYRVRVNVYFPPSNRYFRTRIQTMVVTSGREFWSEVVGVPPGFEGAGKFRKYEVLRFDFNRQKEIYFRLSKADSGRVITTYSLGKLLMVSDPMMGVDANNRLHILHMGAPQSYAHTIIDVAGKAAPQEFYFAKGENRPKLVRVGGGQLVVEGGIPEAMQDDVYEKNEFHKLSELPPGMPVN
ncbi:MAG: hypothetical protein L3J39_11545 [Verrucomicrobiales bacterium]|nr:hypothetical protein [Verrucomicrobiales bacterium]